MDTNIIYAKSLGKVGDKIKKISSKFIVVKSDEANAETLKIRHANYLKAIKEYNECKISLSNIVPPSNVCIEHQKMIDAIQLFIEGTEIMFNSFDINKCTLDIININSGILLQELGEKTVATLSDEIATKLVG